VCYKEGAVVVLEADEADVPVLGIIKHVVVSHVDRFILVVSQLYTVCFNAHFHAYEVTHPSCLELVFVSLDMLADHQPLSLYQCNDLLLVPVKYYVVSV